MQRLVSMLQQAEDYVGTVVDGNLPADPHMGRKVHVVQILCVMFFVPASYTLFTIFFRVTSVYSCFNRCSTSFAINRCAVRRRGVLSIRTIVGKNIGE